MKVPQAEGLQVLLQPLVGRELEDLVGVSPAMFFHGRHGVAPAVVPPRGGSDPCCPGSSMMVLLPGVETATAMAASSYHITEVGKLNPG